MNTNGRRFFRALLRLAGLAALLIAAPPRASAQQAIGGLRIERTGHTATRLPGGKILVVGGENAGGPVCDAEIFDPASRTFSLGAGLMTARTQHTATRLPDGRVLVIGGRSSDRLLDATEVYDSETRSFSPGPVLGRARAGHTATLLPDGRIIVVGGDSEGSVEVFDPHVGAFQRVDARLAIARRYHAAALLRDGTLLIAGGNATDGAVLSSAELLDSSTMSFSPFSPSMRAPRSGLTLRVLPDGKVQTIGGDAEGTMEMFNPVGRYFTAYAHLLGAPGSLSLSLRTQTRPAVIGRPIPAKLLPILGDDVVSLNNDFLDRTDYSLTEIPELGQALGAGGARTSGSLHTSAALYASSAATVTTDQTDYSPGETIIITGTGWQPGETVSLNIHRDTNDPPDAVLTAIADASGSIQNSDYVVQEYDLGLSFLLTATGQSSGYTAQTTFTDGTVTAAPFTINKSDCTTASSTFNVGDTVCAHIGPITVSAPGNGAFSIVWYTPVTNGIASATFYNGQPNGATQNSSFAPATAGTWTVTTCKGDATATGCLGTPAPGNQLAIHAFTVTGCLAPTITTCAPAQSASAGASCQAAVPDFTAATAVSSPGCTATVTQSPTAGTLIGLGPHTITITATNASATATCQTTFTVNDDTKPTITAPAAASYQCASQVPAANVADATASDNCSTPTKTVTETSNGGAGSTASPLVITRTYRATDAAGNYAEATQTITVIDDTKPTITAPAAASYQCASQVPAANVADATASDNCSTPTKTVTETSNGGAGSTASPLVITRTYRATDAAGNYAEATQTITVIDDTKPTITAPAMTFNTGPNATACGVSLNSADLGVSANDNCDGIVTPTTSDFSFPHFFPVGTTTVHWTATDSHSNTATAVEQIITVVDNTKPTITAPGQASYQCASQVPAANATDATASDNCTANPTKTVTETNNGGAGSTASPLVITRTYRATDAAGNYAEATQTITVIDDTKPTVSLTQPADAHAGAGCTAPVPAVVVSASDNCPGTPIAVQDPPAGTPTGPGTLPISVMVTDAHGNTTTASTTFTVLNDTPSDLTYTSPTGPLPKGSATVSLNFKDEAAQVHTCTFSWDDGSPDTTPPPSGLSCSDSHLYNAAGVYSVTITVTDDCGKSASNTLLVVIYDPNAGFVTGGGFINSPTGAYVTDPSLTGKANFGFVSKYQKGATVPTGETEFQFQVAGFNFHSSVYQWLVISGAKAQYKGTGTVNNAGNYGFLLTATDGQLNGGGGVDKFRIKIWDINNGGVVVYDNVLGTSDDIDFANPQAIAGGSIVIHK